jgi:hypothetical protein
VKQHQILPAIASLLCTNSALAQIYAYDPAHPIGSGHVYFGSTKDTNGHSLSGVTVRLDAGQTTYVMVTDDAGRFRIEVPKELTADRVRFSCSKPGYTQLRATTRLAPNKAPSPIQADCVLDRRSGNSK